MTKAQSGIHFSWGLVITIIVAVVMLAILLFFIFPIVSPGGFNESASGFGKWAINIFSAD